MLLGPLRMESRGVVFDNEFCARVGTDMKSRMIRKLYLYVGNFFRGANMLWLRKSGIIIGKNCFISFGAKLDMTRGNIIIGDNCTITNGVMLLSHDPTKRRITPGAKGEGAIVIQDNVYIGVRSIIMMDVTLGHDCIIGAGTVVSKDVPPYAVVVGSQQKILKFRPKSTK